MIIHIYIYIYFNEQWRGWLVVLFVQRQEFRLDRIGHSCTGCLERRLFGNNLLGIMKHVDGGQ